MYTSKRKRTSLEETVSTDRQPKSGFSLSFYWEQMRSGATHEKGKKEEDGHLRKNRDYKKIPQIDVTEALCMPGILT